MNIPTLNDCRRLIREMKMMDHIVDHCVEVCRVSVLIADHLAKRQPHLNRDLVKTGALLHDITKTRSFETGENHALTGEMLLKQLNYPEVGEIVGQHVRLAAYFGSDLITEAEIVNYADKRVLHDRIVSLAKRMEYIFERYGKGPEHRERISWLWEKTILLENRIFTELPFLPDDLEGLLTGGEEEADLYVLP